MKSKITEQEISNLVENFEDNRKEYQRFERRIVDQLINAVGKTKAAKLLKIDRKTLYNKYINKKHEN